MAGIDDNIKIIEKALEKFSKKATSLQDKAYNELVSQISSLSYANGYLKPTKANLLAIGKIKSNLQSFLDNNSEHIDEFADNYKKLEEVNNSYYNDIIENYTPAESLKVMQTASVDGLYNSLTKTGVNGRVASEATNILTNSFSGGFNRNDILNQVRTYMIGNKETLGSLLRYSKQITDDSINQYDASVDKEITNSLGFEWFQYVGGVIDTTRQFCRALVSQRYIHKSEFSKASQGILRTQTVSKAGMYKGTSADNLQMYRGGYQCQHKFRGVLEDKVPQSVRDAVLGNKKEEKDIEYVKGKDLTNNNDFLKNDISDKLEKHYKDVFGSDYDNYKINPYTLNDYDVRKNAFSFWEKEQGYNIKMKTIKKNDLKDLIKKGDERILFRGWGGDESPKYLEKYINGDTSFSPVGVYGNGYYFASPKNSDSLQALNTANGYSSNKKVSIGLLKKNAKVISEEDLFDEYNKYRDEMKDKIKNATNIEEQNFRLLSEPGAYATAKGYDAISYNYVDDKTIIVLNRSAIEIVDDLIDYDDIENIIFGR